MWVVIDIIEYFVTYSHLFQLITHFLPEKICIYSSDNMSLHFLKIKEILCFQLNTVNWTEPHLSYFMHLYVTDIFCSFEIYWLWPELWHLLKSFQMASSKVKYSPWIAHPRHQFTCFRKEKCHDFHVYNC